MKPQPTSPKAAPIGAAARPQTLTSVAVRVAKTYLSAYKMSLVVAAIAALVVAATTSYSIWLVGQAINLVSAQKAPGALIYIPLAIVGLALLRAAATITQNWIINTIGHKMVGRMQVDLFGKVIRSDLARLRAEHSGTVVSSMLYDASLVRNAATAATLNYLQNGLMVIGTVGVMARSDLYLTLAVLLVGPVMGIVIRRFTRWTKKAAVSAMNETSSLSAAIMEGVVGVKVVKIDNREAYEEDHIADVIARRQGHIIRGANIGAASAPVIEVLMAMVIAGVVAYAGWRISRHEMNPGSIVAFVLALPVAAQSLRQLANIQLMFTEGFSAAQRMFAVMDIRAEVGDAADAQGLAERARGFALDHVGFAYSDNGEVALADVTLKADRGETIALVGPSGGGKSTILNLIPRFYDVTEGAITIDGHDVRSLTLASLRDQIALVTQEPFLFDDTIRANIAYARPEAGQDEVEAAAREAAAHDFITAFPAGYDTQVGEAGARLSGGQRQRIAIARAFLKNAPILLLDEATSALDTESEAQVQVALERLMAGRATILIAHRLSTVKGADRIYVIDKGRVVETGTHATLMRARGLYSRLAGAQNLEPAPEAAE